MNDLLADIAMWGALIVLAIGSAFAGAKWQLRNERIAREHRREHRRDGRPLGSRNTAPPAPPAGFRPRDARHHVPMFSTYDGASRLQRARRAASEFIAEIGATNEILPLDVTGVPRTGPRPLGPIDVDAMTRAIVGAWIGEEEPMISVPIMKLGDIRVDRNEEAIQRTVAEIIERDDAARARIQAQTDDANVEREKLGLPPLATGGFVKPGRPYLVGETPSEQTRPPAPPQTEKRHEGKGEA